MDNRKFYITTPIYYVNDKPHIGHAYTTVLADVLSRYNRLAGIPTFFLTGTDEHGQKVKEAAARAGVAPRQQADSTVVRFIELWKKLKITNDDFIRTTEERHKAVIHKILQDLYERDEIYSSSYDGWYCVTCERFYMERDLVDGKCPSPGCGKPVEKIRETNYFFRMSKYQQWLIGYINDHPGFIQPDFRRNETMGFLKKPLNDLCISRPKSRMDWGIELPFDSAYVTYVWFDALVNYISAIGYLADGGKFNKWWPASYHLVGKDILTTHTVYWPTMLKAMNLPMPECVFAHGWWLSGREKMSKSSGNVVNPIDFADRYGVDAFRYFLMAEMSLGQDASFTEDIFVGRYNAELANDLGNVVNRVMKMIWDYCGGRIPVPGEAGPEEESLKNDALSAVRTMVESVSRMKVDSGLAGIAAVIRATNRYLEKKQPWTLGKKGLKDELGTVLYTAVEVLRITSGILHPVMPGKMEELRSLFGFPREARDAAELTRWGLTAAGGEIGKMTVLFPRIDKAAGEGAEERRHKMQNTEKGPESVPGVIDYTEFSKVQLRTARVIAAEKVEGADKLLKLQIDLGSEQRQIVAGIALSYKPEEIIGRTIVVVINLKPAKIRGVESNGMLLAATCGSDLRVVTVDGLADAGSVVR